MKGGDGICSGLRLDPNEPFAFGQNFQVFTIGGYNLMYISR